MVAVKVAEKVGILTLNLAISEGINTYVHARHDLVKRARALVGRLAPGLNFIRRSFSPSSVFGIA